MVDKHHALIIGAGRIGAGYNWHDDAYTHAGAYRALAERVNLVGFVEPDRDRRDAAGKKWDVPTWDDLDEALEDTNVDVVSVCVQPRDQCFVLEFLDSVAGVWCEKPYLGGFKYNIPLQVNYLRRADPRHQKVAEEAGVSRINVWAKNDIHTWPHFMDLAKWWAAPEVRYEIITGPCSYSVEHYDYDTILFSNGGIDPAQCMKGMLANLLDAMEGKAPLFSPAYPEEK